MRLGGGRGSCFISHAFGRRWTCSSAAVASVSPPALPRRMSVALLVWKSCGGHENRNTKTTNRLRLLALLEDVRIPTCMAWTQATQFCENVGGASRPDIGDCPHAFKIAMVGKNHWCGVWEILIAARPIQTSRLEC